MNNYGEYQYLRPRDMVKIRDAMPVAYMGTGVLEWHGLHNPLGFDAVKSDAIAKYLAKTLGGIVMPPQYWGDYRAEFAEIEFDESFKPPFSFPENHFDHTVPIGEIMGVEKSAYLKDIERCKQYGKWEPWEKLMTRTMFQIETIGFKAIIMIPGHYPSIAHMGSAIKDYYKEGGQSKVLLLTETDFPIGDFVGDHAAAYETSMMLVLRPELVDIGELDSDLLKPNIGVIGFDPRVHASKELGEKVLDKLLTAATDFLKDCGLIA